MEELVQVLVGSVNVDDVMKMLVEKIEEKGFKVDEDCGRGGDFIEMIKRKDKDEMSLEIDLKVVIDLKEEEFDKEDLECYEI